MKQVELFLLLSMTNYGEFVHVAQVYLTWPRHISDCKSRICFKSNRFAYILRAIIYNLYGELTFKSHFWCCSHCFTICIMYAGRQLDLKSKRLFKLPFINLFKENCTWIFINFVRETWVFLKREIGVSLIINAERSRQNQLLLPRPYITKQDFLSSRLLSLQQVNPFFYILSSLLYKFRTRVYINIGL